jgi:hypothetical protein
MRIVTLKRPNYLLQYLNMEIGDEELSTFITDALMHPVVELFEGLLLISLLRWPYFVKISLGDFFQLVVVLQLD